MFPTQGHTTLHSPLSPCGHPMAPRRIGFICPARHDKQNCGLMLFIWCMLLGGGWHATPALMGLMRRGGGEGLLVISRTERLGASVGASGTLRRMSHVMSIIFKLTFSTWLICTMNPIRNISIYLHYVSKPCYECHEWPFIVWWSRYLSFFKCICSERWLAYVIMWCRWVRWFK